MNTNMEVWAITSRQTGAVCWSRGGSSTASHLMTFASEASAKRSLRSTWTRQVIDPKLVEIKKIYAANRKSED